MILNGLSKKEEDWKEFLRDHDKDSLKEIFELIQKHRGAYTSTKDVKTAQLWCALLELKKELNDVKGQLKRLEEPFKSIISLADIEKRNVIEKFVSELVKPEESQEKKDIRDKLVESLMNL